MTKLEFTAHCYKILHGKPYIEDGGKIYYSEDAVLDCCEWIRENLQQVIPEEIISQAIDRAIQDLSGSPG